MTEIAALKSALRKELFARRKAAHAEAAAKAPEANARLLDLIGEAPGVVVSGYMPIRSEIDPRPTMTALAEAGVQLCVPVIEGREQPLTFREWTPESEMVDGPFGAAVPKRGEWLEPQILIVPLVGFDRAGSRLGYGGGFYDRTLAILREKKPVRAYGFAYAAQEAEIPVEDVDQRIDGVVTEAEVICTSRQEGAAG